MIPLIRSTCACDLSRFLFPCLNFWEGKLSIKRKINYICKSNNSEAVTASK